MNLFWGIIWMVMFVLWLYTWRKDKMATSLITTLCSLALGISYILKYGGIV